MLVKLEDGADAGAVKDELNTVVSDRFPTVEANLSRSSRTSSVRRSTQLLGVVYALLALAVIVSLFGIVNTLALSIYERTRELGLMRAVGMSRRQVRRIVRYEAVITALIGAVLGSLLGASFAVIMSAPWPTRASRSRSRWARCWCCWCSPRWREWWPP